MGHHDCSFPGRIWKSKQGAYWNQVCALDGSHPWARFTSSDPTLMTWTAADTDFVAGVDPANITSYGAALFHKIPGAGSGPSRPTHMINANSGSQFYVGRYDSKKELLTRVGHRQTLDYSDNFVWAAAGTNGPDPEADTGRLLLIAWVRGGGNGRLPCGVTGAEHSCPNLLSLVRSVSWDTTANQLVSFPVVELETLRNTTYVHGKSLSLAAGASHTLSIPAPGGGAADILASFALSAGVHGFGVSVRSGDVKVQVTSVTPSKTHAGGFSVTVAFNSGPQPCVSVRGQPRCTAPPSVPPPTNATVLVAPGETLDIRILVDRPVVEMFVNKGRAAFVSADANFSVTKTAVALFNRGTAAVQASNVSAFGMGCGWAKTKPSPSRRDDGVANSIAASLSATLASKTDDHKAAWPMQRGMHFLCAAITFDVCAQF